MIQTVALLALALGSTGPCGSLAVSDSVRQNLHMFFTGSSSIDAGMRMNQGVELQDSTIQVEFASDTIACSALAAVVDQNLAEIVADSTFWRARGWAYRVLRAGTHEVLVMLPTPVQGREESGPALAIVLREDEVVTVLMM